MSVAEETTCSLNNDILYDVLRRVDGATLANAACACSSFSTISREDKIWQDFCYSLWPSTESDNLVRKLIDSLGGFRKFYSDSYPLILTHLIPNSDLDYPREWPELDYFEEYEEFESVSPSDFVSLVDLRFNDKPVFSKVLWGVSEPEVLNQWFYNSPCRIDLLGNSSETEEDNKKGKFILSVSDGKDLLEGLRLSWIIVNKKTKQAMNVSSWNPLGVQRHWPIDNDFVVNFGSVLPADDILPCQVVQCLILAKFRMVKGDESGLELTQMSLQLEDMEGSHVNGRNSLMVLKNALNCPRSLDFTQVIECCELYSRIRRERKEEKMRKESRIDRLCILSGITMVCALMFCML